MYAWGHRTRLGHGKLEDDGAWLQHVILSVCQFSMYRTLSFVHSDLHKTYSPLDISNIHAVYIKEVHRHLTRY